MKMEPRIYYSDRPCEMYGNPMPSGWYRDDYVCHVTTPDGRTIPMWSVCGPFKTEAEAQPTT